MKNRATEALFKVGLPMNLKGFRYIVQAMELFDNGWENEKTTALYAKLAKDNNDVTYRVERSIRHALEFIYKKGVREEVIKYFDLNNKTNSAQLACFYYRLCREKGNGGVE